MIIRSLLPAASFIPNSIQKPYSWVGHLHFAAWIIKQTSPKVFVELGTHSGNSYFSFCQSVFEAGITTKCYAVDTWQGDKHAGKYSEETFSIVQAHNQKFFAEMSQLLRMTFDDALNNFADSSIDILHIDGLHTYEAVLHDFESWLPKLSSGALVIFHDTNVFERDFGVWKLWKELQSTYPYNLEFLHSHGLGVLQLNNVPDNKRIEWLKPGHVDKDEIINYFAALGSMQLNKCNLIELQLHSDAERNGQIAECDGQIAERDGQIAERDGQIAERDGQIAERDGQIAECNGKLNLILNSISWKITRVLLQNFGFSAMKEIYQNFRKIISDVSRQAWIALPISTQFKLKLKNQLFNNFAFAFSWSQAYINWLAINGPTDELTTSIARQRVWIPPELNIGKYVPLLHATAPKEVPVRLIAFYLPQFHSIAENDAWWGEGFTEWFNVNPAQPQFQGHYQPHVSGELGCYSLLDASTQYRQIELAKLYGVGGFCFYTYWFDGKLLLEEPIENYLNDSGMDFPFCLCWANENWSRRWDGLDSEILISQKHSPEDDLAFIQHISKYMKDKRYINIDGKPLLVIYRPSLLPSIKETAKLWRDWCRHNGIGEIYLAYTQAFEMTDPSDYGFDAAIEFPPNNSLPPCVTDLVKPLNKSFEANVFDWRVFVERSRNYKKPKYMLFRGVCPSWDNTARRKNKGTIFINNTPEGFQEWLSNAVEETCKRISNPNERLIFVNAWNEWAEGAHLEPDERNGYAYLEATRKALLHQYNTSKPGKIIVVSHDAHPHGAQFLALGMVRSLKQDLHLDVEVVLLGKGILSKDFTALAPVHDLSDADTRNVGLKNLATSLFDRGFASAIINTTVSGAVIPIFKAAGIESVCLVHELPGVIKSHSLEVQANLISKYAKAIVFPAKIVAEGFSQFASLDESKIFIRPQGLYRRNKWRFKKSVARESVRKQLGLNPEAKIVLTVGYADRRKGVDLFVECALNIFEQRNDVHFVWIGHWEESIKSEIENKLNKNPNKNRIHFLGFNAETAIFHAAADVYALTSREDPFPNVVLESFDAGIPVVAFEGSGGATDLLEKVGGVVVPSLDVKKFSDAICQFLDSTKLTSNFGESALNYIDEHFAFRPYLFDLCEMVGITLPKISVVVPNYNYSQYIEQRLASIRDQSIPIFELIILDDASSDISVSKISEWLSTNQTDARVVINHKNSGSVFSQWKQGVSIATGDYIWIAEADDLSDSDFLETVMPPFIQDNVVLSYCDSQQINSIGLVQAKNYQEYLSSASKDKWNNPYVENGVEECKTSLAILNTIPNVSAVVFKRGIISKVLNENFDEISQYTKAGDWVVYLRTLVHGSIAFSPRTANLHRRHDESVIGNSVRKSLLQEIFSVQESVGKTYVLSQCVQEKIQKYRLLLNR